VLSGPYGPSRGPVADPLTDVRYLDVGLGPGTPFELPIPNGYTAFLYPFEGEIQVGGTPVRSDELAVLGEGDRIAVESESGARLLLVAGRPIGEPIVQHGPFVMNTREEIERAFADYRDGSLARYAPERVESPTELFR